MKESITIQFDADETIAVLQGLRMVFDQLEEAEGIGDIELPKEKEMVNNLRNRIKRELGIDYEP